MSGADSLCGALTDAVMSSGVTFGLGSPCGGGVNAGLAFGATPGPGSFCGALMDAAMPSGVSPGLTSFCGGLINAVLASDDTAGGNPLCGGDWIKDASCASEGTVLFCGSGAGGAEGGTAGTFRRMGGGVAGSDATSDRVWGFAAAIGSINGLLSASCESGVDCRASQKTETIKNKTAILPNGIHKNHRRGLSSPRVLKGRTGAGHGAS